MTAYIRGVQSDGSADFGVSGDAVAAMRAEWNGHAPAGLLWVMLATRSRRQYLTTEGDVIAELLLIANDETEAPERRLIARQAHAEATRPSVLPSHLTTVSSGVLGSRGGNDSLRTEAIEQGWAGHLDG